MSKNMIRNARLTSEGDGVEVRRLFPVHGFMNFDPFVLWDNFAVSAGAGFPTHPHRGFEAITYLFDGSMQHKDNMGNESTVTTGGAQRFTAGRGIEHSEMPGSDGKSIGIQMWVNLPRQLKTVEPEYQQVNADEFPEKSIEGGVVRELVGDTSPLQIKTDVRYFEVRLAAQGMFEEQIPKGMRGFVYLVDGSVNVNDKVLDSGNAIFMETADSIALEANTDSHFMVCFGRPHGEPIYQHGPFVD